MSILHDNGCKPKEFFQCISELIELVSTKNHLQFNDVDNLQKLGTAMGTRMARLVPSYASLIIRNRIFDRNLSQSATICNRNKLVSKR